MNERFRDFLLNEQNEPTIRGYVDTINTILGSINLSSGRDLERVSIIKEHLSEIKRIARRLETKTQPEQQQPSEQPIGLNENQIKGRLDPVLRRCAAVVYPKINNINDAAKALKYVLKTQHGIVLDSVYKDYYIVTLHIEDEQLWLTEHILRKDMWFKIPYRRNGFPIDKIDPNNLRNSDFTTNLLIQATDTTDSVGPKLKDPIARDKYFEAGNKSDFFL